MSFSINSYSSIASRNGVGGLLSGMDTDELVEKMTTGTRSKITSQLTKKQLTLWKQEAYRGAIDKTNSFQQKWFMYSSGKNNIGSASFFDTKTIKSSSDYITVSGNASAAERIRIEDIKQLAKTASMTSGNKLSSGAINTGKIETDWLASTVNGQGVKVSIDGKGYNIALTTDFGFKNNPNGTMPMHPDQLKQITENFNKTIENTPDIKGKLKFEVEGGKIKICSIPQKAEDGSTGAGPTLKILPPDENNEKLIDALGLRAVDTDASGNLTATKSANTATIIEKKNLNKTLAGSTITVNLNGISKNIVFNDYPNPGKNFNTPAKLQTYMQDKMDKLYGTGKINVSLTDGKLKMETISSNDILSIDSTDNKDVLGESGALRVFEGTSNRTVWNLPVKDLESQLGDDFKNAFDTDGKASFEINGTKIEFSNEDSLTKILNKINTSDAGVTLAYSTTSDTFNIVAKDSGSKGFITPDANFIKDLSGTLGTALFGDATTEQTFITGQDAILTVSLDNGKTQTEIVRSTNNFSFDGLNIELKGKADGVEKENITFKIETHDEEILTKIKDFIKDYNEVIKTANDLITDRKTKEDREYGPLTDEQKKEMSEDEVKAYEERAKIGILQDDPYLGKMIQVLRSAMSDFVDDDKALWKIGISTVANDWKSNGTLVIDENKLKEALAKDPQSVTELFTKTVEPNLTGTNTPDEIKDAEKKAAMEGGIASRMSFMINANCGSVGGEGLLVGIAGKKGATNGQDRLSRQLKEIDAKLEDLKDRLQTEETRYFKQFTSMETYLNKMNMQSSWLTEQMGGQ